jgi:hypothetical protein
MTGIATVVLVGLRVRVLRVLAWRRWGVALDVAQGAEVQWMMNQREAVGITMRSTPINATRVVAGGEGYSKLGRLWERRPRPKNCLIDSETGIVILNQGDIGQLTQEMTPSMTIL